MPPENASHAPAPLPGIPDPVLVAGAGWIGSALARALAEHESPVTVLATTRSGKWRGEGPLPAKVAIRRLDLLREEPAVIARLFREARAAVACLAPGRDQDRRALYVEGARRFAAASASAALERAVWCSSTSALPALDGWVDEDCEIWPEEERGRIQREAEEAFQQGCAAAGVPWVILRLAGLYGPGRELARVYSRSLAAGAPPLPGDGLEPTNLVHRDDVVAAILAALRLAPQCSTLVHVCDEDHTVRRELVARIAVQRGLPPPRWERAGGPPRGKRVAARRLAEILGVVLSHPRHTP